MVDVPVDVKTEKNVIPKVTNNSKTIQGEDKVVKVLSVKTAKNVLTGDTAPIAVMILLMASAAAVLAILVRRKRTAEK